MSFWLLWQPVAVFVTMFMVFFCFMHCMVTNDYDNDEFLV